MKPEIKRWVRTAWLLLVLGALGFYLSRHGEDLVRALRDTGPMQLSAMIGLALLAKFFVALQMRRTLLLFDVPLARGEFLRLYSYPDIAKYVPGGIWGIVGRVALYREKGIPVAVLARAFSLEHVWLIAGAAVVGCFFYAIFGSSGLSLALGVPVPRVVATGIAAFLAPIWAVAVFVSLRSIGRARRQPAFRLTPVVILEQLIVWGGFGAALYLLLPSAIASLGVAVGACAIAFAAGFVAIFAPAGIGVREAVLVGLLAPFMPTATALTAAVIYRFVLFLADVLFAVGVLGISWLIRAGDPSRPA